MLVLSGLLSLASVSGEKVWLGIDTLRSMDFALLHGKRVGLLTHPAGVDRFGVPTWEILHQSPKVRLAALFGPEHGISGREKANEVVPDRVHPETGLPVFSLYGETRHPSPEMLAQIDVMVIDLQDLGVRSYTYITCMRYVLEACFRHRKEVVVLDRPNPLGGLKVDGPPMASEWISYVGGYQVPYVYGLTLGELAYMAKERPGVLDLPAEDRLQGELTVVPMRHWERSMTWGQTGLEWIPPSPAIVSPGAAFGYSMTGLGAQIGGFRHGFGTEFPFRLLSFPRVPPGQLAQRFNALQLAGLHFEPLSDGRGVYVEIRDWDAVEPSALSLYMMLMSCALAPGNPFAEAAIEVRQLFTKHVGDPQLIETLARDGHRADADAILERWRLYAAGQQRLLRRWHLY